MKKTENKMENNADTFGKTKMKVTENDRKKLILPTYLRNGSDKIPPSFHPTKHSYNHPSIPSPHVCNSSDGYLGTQSQIQTEV